VFLYQRRIERVAVGLPWFGVVVKGEEEMKERERERERLRV
jgi:hypothetical protein